jgi:hypothetical protein
MQKVSFAATALYGDHHVLAVRQILLSLPGVADVYASSCFHVIEVTFDPDQVSSELIASSLEVAGYLSSLPTSSEAMPQSPHRQTVLYVQTRSTVGFKQDVYAPERSAWPCPGMGLLKKKEG